MDEIKDVLEPACAAARARLLSFYARQIELDELVDVVGHLSGCAGCSRVFTEHGRRFGLIRNDFLEFIDPDQEARRALPHPIEPLPRPVDVILAGQAARLLLMERRPAVRFRGGAGGTSALRSTARVGPARVEVAWTTEDPPALLLSGHGEGLGERFKAKVTWSDGSVTTADCRSDEPTRVDVPAGLELAGVELAGGELE
jgi:hypothetical protein